MLKTISIAKLSELEDITNKAYDSLSYSIQEKKIAIIRDSQKYYTQVYDKLKEQIGNDIQSNYTTEKTFEFDRYLLQYIIGATALESLNKQTLRHKNVKQIPNPPKAINNIILIAKKIDNIKDWRRYSIIRKTIEKLANCHNYELIKEAINHVRYTYLKSNIKPRDETLDDFYEQHPGFGECIDKIIEKYKKC